MDTIEDNKSVKQNIIRWAIGSSGGLRSSTWRLWGNKKGDIYFAVRTLGNTIKASFHRDGKCQVGFTEEYMSTATKLYTIQSRHWEKWRLPSDELVKALQVLIPHSELRQFTSRNDRDVIWLPTPPDGSIAVVSLFISIPIVDLSLSPDSAATILGKIKTSTRTAWLVYLHNPIDVIMEKLISNEKGKLRRISDFTDLPPNSRAILWEHRQGHDQHVLELACK
jgi:hypothetical protein